MRAIARIRSVDLSMTMTAAVPRPERSLPRLSKSIGVSMICSAGTMRTEEPPGMTAFRLSQPPRMPPQWRLQPRHALLALEAFQQRRLFTADIGTCAMRHIEVERPAVDVLLADQLRLIGLSDGGLQMLAFPDEFATDIDVAGMRAHRE